MITIEFKMTQDGHEKVYASKAINTLEDYKAFMEEVAAKLSPVEDQVLHYLKQKAKKKMMVTV